MVSTTLPALTWRIRRSSGLHPVLVLLVRRLLGGVLTLLAVSVVVFAATQVLPGNAAYAVLGQGAADPVRLAALEAQLNLDQSPVRQYLAWLGALLTGDPGTSLVNGAPVWDQVAPRLAASLALVALAGVIGTVLGVALGAWAAVRRDRPADHVLSVVCLTLAALPEFVIGIVLVMLFSTLALHLFPAVSILAPGAGVWSDPVVVVLPVATLVLVVLPYIFRMMRAAMVEALESDYVEMAQLKGSRAWRVEWVHALPNALAPTIQVIGLNLLYLAGGIVVVEYLFAFPGVGQGLVNAVNARDIPTIQFIVVVLAAFYVLVNIVTDVVALLATPRRRLPR